MGHESILMAPKNLVKEGPAALSNSKFKKWSTDMVNWDQPRFLPPYKHLTIFFTFLFFAATPLRSKADRTPDIVFRSLFSFGTVEFGITAKI
jgi:hypothetical protein